MGLRGPRSISSSIRRVSSHALTFSTEVICTNEAMETPVAACATRRNVRIRQPGKARQLTLRQPCGLSGLSYDPGGCPAQILLIFHYMGVAQVLTTIL